MEGGIKKKEKYYFIAKYNSNEKYKEKVKILDKEFIKNNKDKCKIIYKNKKYELKEYFEDIDINYNIKYPIKIKIIFIHNFIDMSYMFYKCDTLISLSDNNNKNLNNMYSHIHINNLSFMFYGCKLLNSLPDISKWDTRGVNDMSDVRYVFEGCHSLMSMVDISKWDLSNVNKNNSIFKGCSSLISLPILTKWLESNVILVLKYRNNKNKKTKILDKEFIEKDKDKCKIIYNRYELKLKEYFEDIGNNNEIELILCLDKNISDLSYMFSGCDSLISVEYYNNINQSYKINEEFNLQSNKSLSDEYKEEEYKSDYDSG